MLQITMLQLEKGTFLSFEVYIQKILWINQFNGLKFSLLSITVKRGEILKILIIFLYHFEKMNKTEKPFSLQDDEMTDKLTII